MTLRNWSTLSSFIFLLLTITCICLAFPKQKDQKCSEAHVLLENQKWIHGASNCDKQTDPLIQVVEYDCNTWIFRQNKCVHYEAPFIYLFMGDEMSLLVDTGATEDEQTMPLYEMVYELLESRNKSAIPLIVAHSHSHADHYAGDKQFKGKSNVSVVGLKMEEVKTFFKLNQWPSGSSTLNLGGERVITVLPIPGHEQASLAFYDDSSRLLITGDTFYPGRLYVFDWRSFKQSIEKLYYFARQHEISYIVGTHIEMSSTPRIDYAVGLIYHPSEQTLPLTVKELNSLNEALRKTSEKPERIVFDRFIVVPK